MQTTKQERVRRAQKKMSSYRANVAAILRLPKSGRILVCQRKDHRDCWQFPQGGVDGNEDLIAALHREVEEEIGILPNQYNIISCRTGYRYQFPDGHLKKGIFAGQEQTYFLCDFLGKKKNIVLDKGSKEFVDSKWIQPKKFRLKWIPAFKRDVFKRVFLDFFEISL